MLSFTVVILLVGGIGLTSSYLSISVKDQVTVESKHAIDEIQLAGEMGLQLYHSFTRTQYLLEDRYRKSLNARPGHGNLSNELVIAKINNSHERFRQSFAQIQNLVTRKDSFNYHSSEAFTSNIINKLDDLETKFNYYVSLVEQLQLLMAENYQDGKEFFTITIEPFFRTNLLPLIKNIRQEIQTNHQAKVATLNNRLTDVSRWLGIATLIALVIAISLASFLYQSIANPLKNIARAAKNIARGNLHERIEYQSNNELGQLSRTFNHMSESLSRTTVSRDFVDSIIESMANLLIVTDQDYKIKRINTAGLLMLNVKESELLGKKAHTIFKNSNRPIFGKGTNEKLELIKGAAIVQRGDGKEIPVSLTKGKIKGQHEPRGYVIVASDISAEKEAQEKIAQSLKEKEVLLAEIHHRVKNNLAVISGLLQMQIWESENESAALALQESQLRVQSIALVHEKLYQSESLSYINFDKYIEELLQAVSNAYLSDDSEIKIITDLDNVILNINQAIPCSLLLNELVSNALKHAFSDQKTGCIEISMAQQGDEVIVRVKDDGKGFPTAENDSTSLGMSLVNTLCRQINGELDFKNDEGAVITVKFEKEEVSQFD